ncbi:hypothetical protein B0T20DRAFT_231293 [Sordaria brevicollis]|uniref:Heterokaryon incompatibility domain-containing protein n=1 Tax=Sordaria brevicollis TaxID=83679 RepID=A0AAE0PDE5_SORBR|nr:hypothetical protein B0T20DRAFT_231293 [Sordaria brevicollis]
MLFHSTMTTDKLNHKGHDQHLDVSRSVLTQIITGVIAATKVSEGISEHARSIIANTGLTIQPSRDTFTIREWLDNVVLQTKDNSPESKASWQLVHLALGVSVLRHKARFGQPVDSADLEFVWGLVRDAVTDPVLAPLLPGASRSAQGFLSVPLCSLIKDNRIDELWRLHVWLPDGHRGNRDFAIHSHQPFAQSWILAGEGRDHQYAVTDPEAKGALGTPYAQYKIGWSGTGKGHGSAYVPHQSYSIVENTRKIVHIKQVETALHTRDMSYTVGSGVLHRTKVPADALHATLFYFDSSRGFIQDAPVLGPVDGESYKQYRDVGSQPPSSLANMVEAVRALERLMEEGQRYTRNGGLEMALRNFNSALALCDSAAASSAIPNGDRYKQAVFTKLGGTYRRFGKYEQAKDFLEQAMAMTASSELRIEASGELGVIYRHMDRLDDAKRAFQVQYDTAKQFQAERFACRSIGNLGMVNYQLSQQRQDQSLLEIATKQLLERVERARQIKDTLDSQDLDATTRDEWLKDAITWETIGLSRLSLCYSAQGNAKKAVQSAFEALALARTFEDINVVAIGRFIYGRALLLNGQRDVALQQFNSNDGCTAAIALCKEPSDEHRQYLQELVDAGADLGVTDGNGYSALDYATYAGDKLAQEIVLEGLRRQSGGLNDSNTLTLLHRESKLRKGYRELFQERLRPVLLAGGGDPDRSISELRRVYAESLAEDADKRAMFDPLKFVPYSDFLGFGRFPRSSDNLAKEFKATPSPGSKIESDSSADYLIFFSYRWINKEPNARTPDDSNHTQYRRMIAATEEFLKMHPHVNRDKLGVWVDYVCVDQDDPMPGVSALPMIIAQCNAVISLSDNQLHERAWCSVESMMIQTLKKAYNVHVWYEQVEVLDGGTDGIRSCILKDGPMDLRIVMADKQLTFETDRPKVLFLERQCKLLA